MQGAAAEAEARAAAAEQAQQAAARQLAELQASMAAQAAALTAKYEPQLAELRQAADAATQGAEAAKRWVALSTLLPALQGLLCRRESALSVKGGMAAVGLCCRVLPTLRSAPTIHALAVPTQSLRAAQAAVRVSGAAGAAGAGAAGGGAAGGGRGSGAAGAAGAAAGRACRAARHH